MPNKLAVLPPKLTNNPSWDVVVTQSTPLLSFFNAAGGPEKRYYEAQLDTSPHFNSPNLVVYKNILENGRLVSAIKIMPEKALKDKRLYFWRVRTVAEQGKSPWALSRFFVDTKSDKLFMGLKRAKIKKVEASSGYNAKNIIDYDDPGLNSFWQSPPPGSPTQWLKFDLGKKVKICRIWILSNPGNPDGWLKNFVLEQSNDSKNWEAIWETAVKNNNTFRNIIDFAPIEARYFRLLINEFIGYAAQVNELILYSPGMPGTPKIPSQNYVLIIGNEHNGFTFTELANFVENLKLGLKAVTVPYYEASLAMLDKLPRKPAAIILSGNNADYPNLPMFEHNGEFEIIRQSDIPILGICAGHQFLAMAYGYTRARSMGWSDISAMKPETRMTRVKIKKKDPIFKNIKNNFIAPEIHGWAVVEPAEEFEIIGASDYVQVQKSKKRLIYGVQFHPEINVPYNHGRPLIKNFLEMAVKKK